MLELINYPFHKISTSSPARPYLPIRLVNPDTGKGVNLVAQIDTGADECAFGADYATIIGHNLHAGEIRDVGTANGATCAYSHTISIELVMPGIKYKTNNVVVDFIPSVNIALIGVRSFLCNFVLTVDYPRQCFSLVEKIKPKK